MARTKIQKVAPPLPTYHVADRLKGLAVDSLYSFTEGRRTLAPIDDLTVTALFTTHPWGYSAQLHAHDQAGEIQAAAEAGVCHPLPAGIWSLIRTFRSGPLTWNHAAARLTNNSCDRNTGTVYTAAGAHHYELSSRLDLDHHRRLWDLTVDGQPREHPFAGPTGATDFVIDEYESAG